MTQNAIVSEAMAKNFATEKDSPYTNWVRAEGLDIISAHYVANLHTVELKPWARRGGRGVYINHEASRTSNDCYVCEIPAGGKLAPQRQLFEEMIYVLDGRGSTTVWNDLRASIAVQGEVQHPGSYGIRPGERLSSVLARAGGFSSQAYPYGAVLTRREVRELQLKSHLELVQRVKTEQTALRALPETDTDQKNAKLTAIAQTETTLQQLETSTPIGRLVIRVRPDMKEWRNTAADVPVRDGDVLFVPKKADYVLVNGQVFNPTAISYRPGQSAKWYLSQAGGVTPLADKKAVFVVRADGSVLAAKNNSSGLWSGDPLNESLRPGDAIIVPEKTPRIGGRNLTTVFQAAQVASSVALAVAYIHP